jgi:hypothetical protein
MKKWFLVHGFNSLIPEAGHSVLKFATGLYAQPPFYKELRRPDGSINENLKSQKSFHVLAGYSAGFGPSGSEWKEV